MRFSIYHTNDIHSNFTFLKKVYAYLKKNKTKDDLYFDSGDFTDLASLIVQADMGESALELLLSAGLDTMTLGNNEMDLGYEAVKKIAAKFPIISSNVTDNEDCPIPGLKRFLLLEHAGKRFLILGVSPFYSDKMTPSGYNIFTMMNNMKSQSPDEYSRRILDENKGQYDYCIMLSHSGITVDSELEKRLPEVDLWLGGHSHSMEIHKNYTQSGMGEALGKLILEVNESGIEVVDNIQIQLEEVDCSEFDALLEEKERKADAILSKELKICDELDFDPFSESRLTNFLCDCLHKKFGGDFAMMHAGISEEALKRPVSRKSLILNFPSKLNPTIMPEKGSAILEAIERSLDENIIHNDGRGPGFRGHVLGTLGFSANVDIKRNPLTVYIDGEELNPEKLYTVIADDYLQRGTGYPSLKVPNSQAHYDVWFIRDMVHYFLEDEEVFELSKKKRLRE